MESKLILAINPGSTSTKIAIFHGHKNIFHRNIRHSVEELAPFNKITDQYEFRKDVIVDLLTKDNSGIDLNHICVIMGRGGLIKPVPSGVIEVNEALIHDLKNSPLGEHASNLGGLIADDLAKHLPHAKAYIADPVVVDELDDNARISGHPLFERKSILHALNQKAIARLYARNINIPYEELNLIVAHLGGGITVGAHCKGRIIDVNNGLDGEGPFSPERSGTLPAGDLVRLCFSGKYTMPEILKKITGHGGMVAYLGTNSIPDVEIMIGEGNSMAKIIYDAMAYQVSKAIGEMAAVLSGEVDAILITGGVAFNKIFVNKIRSRVNNFGTVYVYPGEDEMHALAMNGLMILHGQAKILEYK
jgi:butyrate kinase